MKAVFFKTLLLLMVSSCQLYGQDAVWDSLSDNYLPFILHRVDSSIVGASEFLPGFSVSIDLPLRLVDEASGKESLLSIVKHRSITGVFTYPTGKSTPIEYEIVDHRGHDDIYMKTSQGFFLWEDYRVWKDSISFVINWWYCPPASEADLRTLELAESLLTDSLNWHKQDDRRCQDDTEANRWSLFCALKHASISEMGEYNHHSAAMQAVRSAVDEMRPDSEFAHTLMDFNNAPATTHGDILAVLCRAKARIISEIEQLSE